MSELFVKNSRPVQRDFKGNGAVYHGYAGMPDDAGRVYTEEQCEEEARRVANMRLKIARTFYGWWAWDKETDTWDWDNERMTAFYRWLGRMKAAGVTVALNTGWCSPGDINSTAWNGKSPFTVEGDWKKSLENYGNWLSETYYQLVEKRGFDNVKIFVLFTEPQYYSGKPNSPDDTTFSLWLDAARAAHEALKRDGRRDKILLMGPNEGSTISATMLKFAGENAADILDIYSCHNYQRFFSTDPALIKTGACSPSVKGMFERICRPVTLKPHTDYEAVIDMCYRSDFSQEGSFVFGAYKYHESGDIVMGGLLPPAAEGSLLTVNNKDIPAQYKKFSVRFNSGECTKALFGLFCGVKEPSELQGITQLFSQYKDLERGTLYIDSLSLFECESGENAVENHDFSNRYDGWYRTAVVCGSPDPYDEWCDWVDTALRFIPGEPDDKPFCYDEYNCTRDHDRVAYPSELINSAIALMNNGVRSTLLWTLFDQQWPNDHSNNSDSFVDGDHRCGTMPLLSRSLIPYPSFYAFSLLSRYTAAGSKIYSGGNDGGVSASLAVSPDGQVTIIVANTKAESDELKLDFEKPLGCSLNRHLYDPATHIRDERAEIIGIDKVFTDIGNSLCDTLPPHSVAVYTTYSD